jgi:hypothetical protein
MAFFAVVSAAACAVVHARIGPSSARRSRGISPFDPLEKALRIGVPAAAGAALARG